MENKNENINNISICWQNLSIKIKPSLMNNLWISSSSSKITTTTNSNINNNNERTILKQLYGQFVYCSLNAVMGPSGSGKTTLLNFLSGTHHNVDNNRLMMSKESKIEIFDHNDHFSQSSFSSSYFIGQHVHEIILGRMTVGDILNYAFRFKNIDIHQYQLHNTTSIDNNKKVSKIRQQQQQQQKHIHMVLSQLMLPVDILARQFSQCSGGEQKRIAIAQELMSLRQPSFLFLDEPTTGLDSVSALEVVKCFRNLIVTTYQQQQSRSITIIASIHAPSHETISLFDQIYVLSKGGVCIYSGSIPDYSSISSLIVSASASSSLETDSETKTSTNSCKLMKIMAPSNKNYYNNQPPVEALIEIACKGMH